MPGAPGDQRSGTAVRPGSGQLGRAEAAAGIEAGPEAPSHQMWFPGGLGERGHGQC